MTMLQLIFVLPFSSFIFVTGRLNGYFFFVASFCIKVGDLDLGRVLSVI